MNIQYKPTKDKKGKGLKLPKATKSETVVGIGAAQTVKFDKPQKVKQPKVPKAPKESKAEKAIAFKPNKVENATKFEGAVKTKQHSSLKLIAIILAVIAVTALAITLVVKLRDTEMPVEPKSLTIVTTPAKTTYYIGEAEAFYDLKVKLTMSNGATIMVEGNECEVIGFDSSAAAEHQTITVKYRGLQTTFTVTIKEMAAAPTGKYCGLSFKTLPTKTTYKVGEWPDPTGGVLLVHYDDGTTREMELTNDYVYGFTTKSPGTYPVTVKYVEQGIYGETTYTITVTK